MPSATDTYLRTGADVREGKSRYDILLFPPGPDGGSLPPVSGSGLLQMVVSTEVHEALADATGVPFEVAGSGAETLEEAAEAFVGLVVGGLSALAEEVLGSLSLDTSGESTLAEVSSVALELDVSGESTLAEIAGAVLELGASGDEALGDASVASLELVFAAAEALAADALVQAAVDPAAVEVLASEGSVEIRLLFTGQTEHGSVISEAGNLEAVFSATLTGEALVAEQLEFVVVGLDGDWLTESPGALAVRVVVLPRTQTEVDLV